MEKKITPIREFAGTRGKHGTMHHGIGVALVYYERWESTTTGESVYWSVRPVTRFTVSVIARKIFRDRDMYNRVRSKTPGVETWEKRVKMLRRYRKMARAAVKGAVEASIYDWDNTVEPAIEAVEEL